ncbi:MAG: hypothetical protein L6R39_005782 [Caloplaca ligustica]|nr:MAG: hypothetical protein L6R39_005782 [Caloplaca ligustica]
MTLFSCFSRLLNRNVIRPNPLPGSTRVIFQILASRTYSSEDIQCRHEESRALENDEISRDPSLVNVADIPAPHTGHIRVITLNSPHNKNAISRPLLWDLGHQIRRTQDQISREADLFLQEKRPGAAMGQGTRAIVIGSEVDGVFCAGADLKERKTMTEDETRDFLYRLRQVFNSLSKLNIPTISAVSSVALGGGLEAALATDFRVFTPATLVGLPETRLGIIPGAGGVPRLKSLLGRTRAADIILTGRRIRGEEALRIGLCDRLCGPSLEDIRSQKIGDHVLRQHALDGALDMAKEICQGGPATTMPLMRLMKSTHSVTMEPEAYDMVLKTEDRNQALRAFAEKRKPVFLGR